jgi:hypothetical protein
MGMLWLRSANAAALFQPDKCLVVRHVSPYPGQRLLSGHNNGFDRSNFVNLILLIIVLLILFGGGGFYYGGPYVGGGIGTILLIVLIVLLVRG